MQNHCGVYQASNDIYETTGGVAPTHYTLIPE